MSKDSLGESLRNAGIGGSNNYVELDGYNTSDFVKQSYKKLEKIKNKLEIQEKSQKELLKVMS